MIRSSIIAAIVVIFLPSAVSAMEISRADGKGSTRALACDDALENVLPYVGGLTNSRNCKCQEQSNGWWHCTMVVRWSRQELNVE